MIKLKNIWLEKDYDQIKNVAIRIDWNNDRHHCITLNDETPESIIIALKYALKLLIQDKECGKL